MTRSKPIVLAAALGLLLASWGPPGAAVAAAAGGMPQPQRIVNVSDTEGLRNALRQARMGTHIRLRPGEYRGGLYFAGVRGTQRHPIVVMAADPTRPPVIRGGSNGIQFSSPAHLILQDLVFEGATTNGLNIDDGGTMDFSAHDIVMRRLQVRNVGDRGNQDGIKLSGVTRFRIEQCTIEHWGEGGSAIDMVGCSHGVIEGSTFRHREGLTSGNGVQAKGGSEHIIVRHCNFYHAGERNVQIGGLTGLRFFRPQPPQGAEARHITVEGCILVGARAAVAFVSAEDSTFRHNTIYRPQRWVIRILQEQRAEGIVPCRNNTLSHNLIVYRQEEIGQVINVGPGTQPGTFNFSHNFWYCEDRPRSVPPLPAREQNGTYGRDPLFNPPVPGDFSVADDSPARHVGAHSLTEPTRLPGEEGDDGEQDDDEQEAA